MSGHLMDSIRHQLHGRAIFVMMPSISFERFLISSKFVGRSKILWATARPFELHLILDNACGAVVWKAALVKEGIFVTGCSLPA